MKDKNFLKLTITEKGEVKVISQEGFRKVSKYERATYLDVAKDLLIHLWLKAENELEEAKRNAKLDRGQDKNRK